MHFIFSVGTYIAQNNCQLFKKTSFAPFLMVSAFILLTFLSVAQHELSTRKCIS
jgi:hypothetical protein